MLRQPLRSMFARVTSTKVDTLGVKAEFERRLATAEALVPPSPAEVADETSDPKLNMVVTAASLAAAAVAEVSPKVLILETWSAFEATTRSILNENGPPTPETRRGFPITMDAVAKKLGLAITRPRP